MTGIGEWETAASQLSAGPIPPQSLYSDLYIRTRHYPLRVQIAPFLATTSRPWIDLNWNLSFTSVVRLLLWEMHENE